MLYTSEYIKIYAGLMYNVCNLFSVFCEFIIMNLLTFLWQWNYKAMPQNWNWNSWSCQNNKNTTRPHKYEEIIYINSKTTKPNVRVYCSCTLLTGTAELQILFMVQKTTGLSWYCDFKYWNLFVHWHLIWIWLPDISHCISPIIQNIITSDIFSLLFHWSPLVTHHSHAEKINIVSHRIAYYPVWNGNYAHGYIINSCFLRTKLQHYVIQDKKYSLLGFPFTSILL